jgi:Flp pilus assembly protein TadG
MESIKRYSNKRNRRGASIVEFGLVLFVLSLLLFGIIEFGLLFRDKATLAQAAREAARSLSVGSAPTVATQRAISAASGLTLTSGMIALKYQTPDSSGNVTATGWTTMTNTSTTNSAASGDLVQVTITYSHQFVTSFVVNGNKTKNISSTMIMRKE